MCDFCEKEKTMMETTVIDPHTIAFCGDVKQDSVFDFTYKAGVFIDIRGYLRLVDIEDCQCLDGGQKIKIKFCPICGEKIKKD